jgi:predicted O-methyltransferase YrrM
MTSPSLRALLAEAPAHLSTYLERTKNLSHEHKGIRRSEMFFFYAAVAGFAPKRILESGRARAQSTLVLSSLFPEAEIISIEFDAASPDVAIAEERLKNQNNVELRFGDSRKLLPKLLRAGDVVLIDGPKDFRAVKLALALLRTKKPAAVFMHDLWLGSPARPFVDRELPEVFLSDHPEWVALYAQLDSKSRGGPVLSAQARVAYGATLGCFPRLTKSGALLRARCALAQAGERLRESARKFGGEPPRRRPKDFAVA